MTETATAPAQPAQRPPKALGKKAKRGVAWSFLREGGNELLVFPASMVLARLLTPEEFGIATAAGFFTLLAGQLSALGLNAAIVRIKVVREEHLSTVFAVNVLVGLLTFGVLTASAPLVASFYRSPETGDILPIAALGFLISPFGTVPAAVLTREMRFRETAMADWFHLVAFSGVSLLLAWLGFSYMSMVYGRLAGLATLTVSRIAYSPWRPSFRLSIPALREIFSFGVGVHAKRLLDYSAQNVDNLLVGRFYGMVTLGIYDKAFSTMSRVLSRMNAGGPGVTFRIFAIIQDDPERFGRAYRKVVMSVTLLAFPLFGVLIAVAPQFLTLLFGNQWRPAAVPFQILCVGGALKLINTYASAAIQAAGLVWSEVWRQVLYVALIVAGLIALQDWGAVGAATAVLIGTAVMTVLMHVLLTKVTQLGWTDILRTIFPGLACTAICAGTALLTEFSVRATDSTPAGWVLLACQAASVTLVYSAFMLFAPIPALRTLVQEMYQDLAPTFLKRQRWLQALLQV